MNFNRLATFNSSKKDFGDNVSLLKLSLGGFAYDEKKVVVKCEHCGKALSLENLTFDSNPSNAEYHASQCPMISVTADEEFGSESEDQPMVPSVSYLGALQSFSNASEEQKVRPRPCEHVSYGAIANLTEANTRANPTNSITEMPSQADIPKASVSYCYKACSLGKSPSCAVFKTNVSRLFTFPSHNPNWLSTPEHLASAGFFCTEDPDHLQCFQCGLEIERKNNDANIVAVHDQHRPQCRLSRKSQANNLNAIQEAACGHHQAFHVNTTNFSEHPCRVASFLPMSCPQHLKTISNNLASQGVFWTGRENIVYCFCCKASWSQDPSDDPDAIHRQQQPNCPCLRNND